MRKCVVTGIEAWGQGSKGAWERVHRGSLDSQIRKFAESQNVIRLPFAVMVGFLTDLVIEHHASFVFDNTDRVWYHTISE